MRIDEFTNLWLRRYAQVTDADRSDMEKDVATFAHKPLLSVLMPVYNPEPVYFRQALESVLAQTYPYWELCIADDASTNGAVRAIIEEYRRRDCRLKVVYREVNGHISRASNSALALVTGEYVALMDHDDLLTPDALYCIAEKINSSDHELDLLYSDEDKVDNENRLSEPFFKPDWNYQWLLTSNYINHLSVYRTDNIRKIDGFRVGYEGSQDYDLVLRFLQTTTEERICHIPRVLYHWRIFSGRHTFSNDNRNASVQAAARALADHLSPRKINIMLAVRETGYFKVDYALPSKPPMVSVLIIAGKGMEHCVQALLSKTDYPMFELIIADNGTDLLDKKYLHNISRNKNVRVLPCKETHNASATCNFVAKHARGELLLFLSDTVKVREPGWLRELVQTILSEGKIGIVGAKLLYADDTVRHIGFTLGLRGLAGCSMHRHPYNSLGYFANTYLTREVSAVSGACMLVRKSLFEKLRGFDALNLPLSYNDIDFCLRVRQAGWKVVINPHACLYHPEQTSYKEGVEPEIINRERKSCRVMLKRHGTILLADPCYNPNLSITSETFPYAMWPRAGKPWRPWLEIVCPFSRSVVLQAMQVCYYAYRLGVRLRLHIPSGYVGWLSDFVTPFPVVGIPLEYVRGEDPDRWFYQACNYVADRHDSSGHLVGAYRSFDLPQHESMNSCLATIEYMLYKLRLPIGARVFNFYPEEREIEDSVSNFIDDRTALVCPYGNESMEVLPKALIEQILTILKQNGWKIIQAGEAGQEMVKGFDGYFLVRRTIGWWRNVIDRVGLIIGCDSWLTHLAAVLDKPQVTFYGPSYCRECGSKGFFASSEQEALVFDTCADCASTCSKRVCSLGYDACIGFSFNVGSFAEYIRVLKA